MYLAAPDLVASGIFSSPTRDRTRPPALGSVLTEGKFRCRKPRFSKWQNLDLSQVSLLDTFITLPLSRKPFRQAKWLSRRHTFCSPLSHSLEIEYLFTGILSVMHKYKKTTHLNQICNILLTSVN